MEPQSHLAGGEEALTREPDIADVVTICRWLNEAGANYVLVGGFAMVLHGYPRFTADIDLLIGVDAANEAKVLGALARLPDGAAKQVRPGDVAQYGVVRIGDEVLVDLMKSGCGVDYEQAAKGAETMWVDGVAVPVASCETLWRMKQTMRDKDIPDRVFLSEWARQNNVTLDPPVAGGASDQSVPAWIVRLVNWFRPRRSRGD